MKGFPPKNHKRRSKRARQRAAQLARPAERTMAAQVLSTMVPSEPSPSAEELRLQMGRARTLADIGSQGDHVLAAVLPAIAAGMARRRGGYLMLGGAAETLPADDAAKAEGGSA